METTLQTVFFIGVVVVMASLYSKPVIHHKSPIKPSWGIKQAIMLVLLPIVTIVTYIVLADSSQLILMAVASAAIDLFYISFYLDSRKMYANEVARRQEEKKNERRV